MELGLEEAIEIREKSRNTHEDLLQEGTVHVENEEQETASGSSSSQATNELQSYQFSSGDNNQVAYRVVQVGGHENQQTTLSIVTTNGIIGNNSDNQQVTIVASPYNNESGTEGGTNTNTEGEGTRFTYFPSSSGGSSSMPSPTSTNNASQSQSEQSVLSGGQFYVMMSPQDVMQTGQGVRTLVARAPFTQKSDTPIRGENRDFNRRVQHNEVERRRRDKINTWITKLAALVPDCANDHTKQGQSKGGILSKACDHIADLQSTNAHLSESCKDYERIQIDNELLKQQLDEAKQKIDYLTHTLHINGIEFDVQPKQMQN